MITLTLEEQIGLKKLHKSLTEKRKADRVKMILLLDKGFSQKEVAELLILDEDTVTKWKNNFLNRTDISSWIEDSFTFFLGKLSYHQLSRIRTYCEIFKVQCKQEILDFIRLTMFIEYSLSGVQKLLIRIGLSHQQMHRLPGKVDVNKQEVFLQKYENIIEELTDNQTVVFIDAVHPQHNSEPSKIWSQVGESRWINSNTGRERININGAYNPFTQDVIVRQDKTINGVSTIELLKQITTFYENKFTNVFVISDNGRSNKSKLVKAWIAEQSFIKIIYLPPYSPNLNLIERLWKFMRKKVINTKYYSEFKEFKGAINDFFDKIDTFKNELKTFIGLKFQSFKFAKTT
jgi:transposase